MTYRRFFLATATLGFAAACGGDEPAGGSTGSATTPSVATEASTTEASTHPEPAPAISTEAPTGTPASFAELCAAQRQALKSGTQALTALALDLADEKARSQLQAAQARLFELEPLVLTLTPPDAATAVAEAEALGAVRERFGAARNQVEATPAGALVLQEIQAAASSGD